MEIVPDIVVILESLSMKWEVVYTTSRYNVFLLENPMECSGNMALTKPVVMSGGSWMDDEND